MFFIVYTTYSYTNGCPAQWPTCCGHSRSAWRQIQDFETGCRAESCPRCPARWVLPGFFMFFKWHKNGKTIGKP